MSSKKCRANGKGDKYGIPLVRVKIIGKKGLREIKEVMQGSDIVILSFFIFRWTLHPKSGQKKWGIQCYSPSLFPIPSGKGHNPSILIKIKTKEPPNMNCWFSTNPP